MGFMARTSDDMLLVSLPDELPCSSLPAPLLEAMDSSTSVSGSRPLLTAAYALVVCAAASDNCSLMSSLIPSKDPGTSNEP